LKDVPSDKKEPIDPKKKTNILKALVHAADIGNPTRPYQIAKMWAEKIVKEFFYQGDKERAFGLEISMLCDRHKVNFATSQIGFLNFVIQPYFTVISDLIPKMKFSLGEIKANVDTYKSKTAEYDKLMKEGNTHL
jgi:hypothetical protein